ncbi:hypothetical protein UQ76_20220 [Shigella boydii]|nr:hypothetical protein [Escherichia coli]RIF80904.1 hypothetical protein UQ76_20220 [Shigella boydii]HAG9876443.1 hypothetical protein [Escherichia coli]
MWLSGDKRGDCDGRAVAESRGGLLRKDASARTRDKEGIVFVRTGREAGVLIIAELFSEVVTVSQPVPGEQETDITDGIRLSDWYYKYKKSSESNVKDLPE